MKNIIVKALAQSVIGWLLLGLILSLVQKVTFVASLTAPSTILIAVSAFFGCCIGYMRKAKR